MSQAIYFVYRYPAAGKYFPKTQIPGSFCLEISSDFKCLFFLFDFVVEEFFELEDTIKSRYIKKIFVR